MARVRSVVWNGKALLEGQEPFEYRTIGRDITKQKEAEQALKESEKTLRALFNAITEPVALLDLNGILLALNETIARIIGKEPQEIVGTHADDYFDPEVMAQRKKHMDNVVRTGKPERFEFERAGRHYEDSVYRVFDDQGQVIRFAVYARDVTIQKQAQRELETKSRSLEEMNAALKVLLDRRELDRKELEDNVISNVRKLILPTLGRLRDCTLDDKARTFCDLLETGLKEIISPFLKGLEAYRFTPRELEIVSLVRGGRATKEIARALNVCPAAVDIYRHQIRRKLGIDSTKTDLRSHLLSLTPH
jgi:PAS domain S-box-containing protein